MYVERRVRERKLKKISSCKQIFIEGYFGKISTKRTNTILILILFSRKLFFFQLFPFAALNCFGSTV